MSTTWHIESLTVAGGFLAGISLRFLPKLVCIIGPRGSGKSTLAEAIRYGIGGILGASSKRQNLVKANLGTSLVTLDVVTDLGATSYSVRRSYGQSPALASRDGRVISSVDLDRGTFLPLDGYDSDEIEMIAEERLGDKRRALLDELKPNELQILHQTIAQHRRQLDLQQANSPMLGEEEFGKNSKLLGFPQRLMK